MTHDQIMPLARPLAARINALLSPVESGGGESEVVLMALTLALAQNIHLARAPQRRAGTYRSVLLMLGHELQALEFSEGAGVNAAA